MNLVKSDSKRLHWDHPINSEKLQLTYKMESHSEICKWIGRSMSNYFATPASLYSTVSILGRRQAWSGGCASRKPVESLVGLTKGPPE